MDSITSNNRVPNLRFPGFEGEWEEIEFGKLIKESRESSKKEDEDILLTSAIDGVFLNSEKFSHQRGQSTIGYRKIKKGMLILSAQNLHLGNANVNLRFESGLVSPAYKVYTITGCLPEFMAQWIKKDTTKSFFLRATTQGASQCRKNVVWEQLYKQTILVPASIEEQKKISDCLTVLDKMISDQMQRIEFMKAHKKGLMQQLFPRNGETTPRLRFPGFSDEWEYVYGNELFKPVSNKEHNSDLPILALTQDQGAVPREMINYNVVVSDKSVAGYKVVEIDDFIISLRSFQGGIEYSRYKGLCSPAYIILRKKDSTLSSDFYRIYFKSYNYIQELNKNLEGIRDGKMISYQQFSEIKLPLPSNKEQQKIAECISALDNVISAETNRIDALKAHKKGLMQQLFPQPVK